VIDTDGTVILPGVSGPEVAATLNQASPCTRTLLMSGFSDHALVRDSMACVRSTFLEKPFSPASLTRKVREVLDAPAADRVGTMPLPLGRRRRASSLRAIVGGNSTT